MEKIVEENIELRDKIDKLRSELLSIHITNDSMDNTELIKEIYAMKEVTNDLKELLIILHTNNVTAAKHTKEVLVTSYDEVLKLTSDIIEKQDRLVKKIIDDRKGGSTIKERIINALTSPIVLIPTFVIILIGIGVGMVHFLPEETGKILKTISNVGG